MTDTDMTQWTTVEPYLGQKPNWIPAEDQTRIAAYTTYEMMYWNVEETFELIRRDQDGSAVLLPKPMTIVDTTAYYLLKDLKVELPPEAPEEQKTFFQNFLDREAFYSRFHTAKASGIRLGDWVFHITADPEMPQGERLSLTSVDPATYLPEYDPDDMQTVVGVRLVEQWPDPEDENTTRVRVLRYWYEGEGEGRRVWREEALWKQDDWDDEEKAELIEQVLPAGPLPDFVRTIPVYHFKNKESDGYPFGNSELRGLERIFQAMDQAVSDEEIALALSGLGVYVTDAGRPINEATGKETDWVAFPGAVWEMPGATLAKRLDGVSSVTPIQDHLEFLDSAANQASGTSDIALGKIDANTAESGVALAIKFIPTLAKIELRDEQALAVLRQMFWDLRFWFSIEDQRFEEVEFVITLGDKLPINRNRVIEELNNMYDREVISGEFYRQVAEEKLGYKFPANIFDQILKERREIALAEGAANAQAGGDELLPGPGGRLQGEGDTLESRDQNRSNNANRVNESDGTEISSE